MVLAPPASSLWGLVDEAWLPRLREGLVIHQRGIGVIMSVPYQVYDLRQQKAGATVVVILKGNAANVRLMTSSAFSAYKAGRNFQAIQGLVKKSPVRLRIPNGGHWYVVVDLVGLGGRVSSSARVEPPPLPALPFWSNTSTNSRLVGRYRTSSHWPRRSISSGAM
jgi:hypothetical protein